MAVKIIMSGKQCVNYSTQKRAAQEVYPAILNMKPKTKPGMIANSGREESANFLIKSVGTNMIPIREAQRKDNH